MSTAPERSPSCSRVRSAAVVRLVRSASDEGPRPDERGRVGDDKVNEQLPHPEEVLFGQDLGRRHEGPLVTALHGHEQRHHGYDGLARPHVTLQQPVHGKGAGEVGLDLGHGAVLGARSTRTEARPRTGPTRSTAIWTGFDGVADAAGVTFGRHAAHDHLELEAQQLVERQAVSGPVALGEGLRRVDAGEGVGAAHELELFSPPFGHGVGQVPRRGATPRPPIPRTPTRRCRPSPRWGRWARSVPVRLPTRSTTGLVN